MFKRSESSSNFHAPGLRGGGEWERGRKTERKIERITVMLTLGNTIMSHHNLHKQIIVIERLTLHRALKTFYTKRLY